jgi:uncharacterized protein YkwD
MNRLHPVVAAALAICTVSGLATSVVAFTSAPDLVAVADTPAVRTSAVQVADTAPPPPTPTTPAEEVVALTNSQRAAIGLPPLVIDAAVTRAAETHSADQAAMRRMSHTGSDGSNAGQRLTRVGYAWRAWGENVAAGQRSAPDVTDAWLGSPGHRANMLDPMFEHIGVAVAYDASGVPYWTMVLATPR